MPDPYVFTADTNPVQVNTTYLFETIAGHRYAITFIEAIKITDMLDCLPVISNAIYVIVDVKHQNGDLVLDARIGVTIINIVKHYLHQIGAFSILVFNCDVEDGKQIKRHNKFDRWYKTYALDMQFEKIDEEILVPSKDVYLPTFISILYVANHPRKAYIRDELQVLRNSFNIHK